MKVKDRKNYYALAGSYHSNFVIAKVALHISTDYPHQGASPDGVTDCDCSDKGLVEIKCTCKYSTDLNDRKITNILLSTHQKMLKKDHPYFAQMQRQMFLLGAWFYDFFV